MLIAASSVLLVVFIWAYWKNSIVYPIVIYLMWLAIYPLVTLVYYDVLNNPLIGITPYFSQSEIQDFGWVSISALVGVFASMIVFFRSIPQAVALTNESLEGRLFLICAVIFLGLVLFLVVYNKDIYLNSYVYQELRVSGFDSKISSVVNVVTFFEILFLVSMQAFIILNLKIKRAKKIIFIFLVIGCLYLGVKVAIGSRIMFVVYIISFVFWLQARGSIKGYRNITVVGLFLLLFLLMAFNMARNPDNGIAEAVADFGKEFVFASISALYSIGYANEANTPNLFSVISDSLISVVPSIFLGGGGEKSNLLSYEIWKDSIGGYTKISPIGGYYLPGQVYLFTDSIIFVFLFFFVYGWGLIAATKGLSRNVVWWKKLCCMQVMTFGVVFGMRTELWVLLKMYMQQFFILSIALYVIHGSITALKFNSQLRMR